MFKLTSKDREKRDQGHFSFMIGDQPYFSFVVPPKLFHSPTDEEAIKIFSVCMKLGFECTWVKV